MWWWFLIIAAIVITGGTVVLGVLLCRVRGNRNNQPQNQNLLIENAEEVIGNNNLNLQPQNQVLLIGNVGENQNNLINESGLHGNIIRESNGTLNLERKNVVDQETIKRLFGIFAKIAENWQNIADIVANLYYIKDVQSVFVLNEAGSKLQKISKHLTDASKNLIAIKDFSASVINSKLVSDFLDRLERVVYDTDWVDDIKKNYRKYIEECYVNMGNKQGGQKPPNNNPQIKNLGNLNSYIADLRRSNNDEGPENFEEMVNMLNAERRTNTQQNNRINNVEERIGHIEEREDQMNKNVQAIQNAMTEVTNQLKLMNERDKQHEKELEEIKNKNKEESEKRQKEIEEMKRETERMRQKTVNMQQKTVNMQQKNFNTQLELFGGLLGQIRELEKKRKENDKEHADLFDKLNKKLEDNEETTNKLSKEVHSLSSQNSSKNNSFQIFGSDQETPGNEQNANFGFKNANDNIDINLNVNQKENEKNDEKKSLIDRIKKVKNKEEDKKEQIPKQVENKEFEEDKKEDEKK